MDERIILERRYRAAIARLGGAPGLLNLPEEIKRALANTNNLRAKVKLLELIIDAKGGH